MKILVHFDFTAEQLDTFQQIAKKYGDHQIIHAQNDEEAVAQAPEAEALLGFFKPAVCAAAPKLRWIQSFSAGMNNFLFPEIVARREVTICNTARLFAPQGGEHAWALLLALARGIVPALQAKERRQWRGGAAIELTGGVLGVIGMGGFGAETIKRAAGYDLHIIVLDPVLTEPLPGVAELKTPERDHLHDLLRRADAVVVACPLTAETHHLIGREELALMKNSAYLINVTRGGIIDEDALAAALKNEQIAGAGLDVFETEPLPDDSPLWDAPNLIITPHRAGASQHRPRKIFEFFCEQLERYLQGQQPLNIVDTTRGF